MSSRYLYTVFLPLLFVGCTLLPFLAIAQTGSSDPTVEPAPVETKAVAPETIATSTDTGSFDLSVETSSTTVTETKATSTVPVVSTPRETGSQVSAPAVPRTNPALTELTPSAFAPASSSDQDTPDTTMLFVAVAVLAILPFGYLVVQSLKKKSKKTKKDTDVCFDIKNLLEEKFKELTDLKGRLAGMAKEKARDALREGVRGTSAGDTLALLEKAEKEYGRLKKLYEECTLEFGKRVFKGTIVENSLRNKDILEKVKIEKTYHSNDWKLYDVFVGEKRISELPKYLADGPWYIHLWEEGKDEVRIIFKDKSFTVQSSDKSTWVDAIAYGKSIGIPDEQLDFYIK